MPTGYIYEIKSKDTSITETYIGSTWDMGQRIVNHASFCYNENGKEYNYPVYKYIRENGGFHTFTMRVIDSGECEDRTELRCAEQFYIDMAGGVENLLNGQDALEDKQQRKEKTGNNVKRIHATNVLSKKFYCKSCKKAFQSNRDLVRHYASKKHKLAAENQSKNP